jgi:hypothetical protein
MISDTVKSCDAYLYPKGEKEMSDKATAHAF